MTSVVIFKIENSKGLGDRKKYCMHEKNLMIKIAAFFSFKLCAAMYNIAIE